MVTKLRLAEERMKRRHDDSIMEYYEFYPGDMVLLKNRASVRFFRNKVDWTFHVCAV